MGQAAHLEEAVEGGGVAFDADTALGDGSLRRELAQKTSFAVRSV